MPSVTGIDSDTPRKGYGVKGTSAGGDGVLGISTSNAHAGVSAINDSGGFGMWARGTPAGHFQGNVEISGNGQIKIDPELPTITMQGRAPEISLFSTAEEAHVLSMRADGILTQMGLGILIDTNAITISTGIGGVVINSNLTVNGNAKFQGGKQGFLVDEFVNCSETVLERGDLLTLRKTEAKERYGDRIPVPQVELAREAYAVEVCGVVDGPALQ